MRTSQTQFQLLVEFMEKYGDLSKPTEGPRGRIANIKHWDELTTILNSDATGDTKTAEKWRKVWCDYKNNIKKKASRIYRAAQRTGGGPASKQKLTEVEERVLRLVGTRGATGFTAIPEIGIEEETNDQPPPDSPSIDNQIPEILLTLENWNQAGPSTETPLFPPSHGISVPRLVDSEAPQNPQETVPHEDGSETGLIGSGVPTVGSTLSLPLTLPLSTTEHHVRQSPTPLPPTPRRRRRGHLQDLTSPRGRLHDPSSPIRRRSRTQTQSELARQAFVRSDCEWRAFKKEAEKERNKLRELELRMQERWIKLGEEFFTVFKTIADNLGNR